MIKVANLPESLITLYLGLKYIWTCGWQPGGRSALENEAGADCWLRPQVRVVPNVPTGRDFRACPMFCV